jgi:uncharacterized protein
MSAEPSSLPDPSEPETVAKPELESESSSQVEAEQSIETVILQVICPRCQLETPDTAQCIHCFAYLKKPAEVMPNWDASSIKKPKINTMIVAYVLLLSTSLLYAFILHGFKHLTEADQDAWLIAMEVLDGIITFSLFLFIGRVSVRRPKRWKRALAWCLAPLASVIVFFLAHWYVEALRKYIDLDWLYQEHDMKLTLFTILTTAVQPAIIEEIFFRYFAYGVLRELTHVHSAVVLSALMFALAHLYNPFGLPILFLIGLILCYARAYSGGLLLPMLMHFGHNFTIIYMESMR